MRVVNWRGALALFCLVALVPVSHVIGDGDLPSKFSNIGTVANSRHNLTQRQKSGGGPSGAVMDPYRNDYAQICVYCHTPHGSDSSAAAPLWNRVLPNPASFTTYAALRTDSITQEITAPGANSLPCLSCHDGQTAVDAVLNMPGAGRYSTSPNNAFLSTWSNPSGTGPYTHMALKQTECLACHSSTAGFLGAGATDFTVFVIGTDLRNDHPIGVKFPGGTPETTGFNSGTKTTNNGKILYYDVDSNNKLNKNEPRFYDAGDGPKVECASCHDPHGVQSGSNGSQFYPTFLRANPAGSTICLTCHAK